MVASSRTRGLKHRLLKILRMLDCRVLTDAWIETLRELVMMAKGRRRVLTDAWIETLSSKRRTERPAVASSRTRGLKLPTCRCDQSASRRRVLTDAWIETLLARNLKVRRSCRVLTDAWIETLSSSPGSGLSKCRVLTDAWIETPFPKLVFETISSRPHGRVD